MKIKIIAVLLCLGLAACGGGGGSSTSKGVGGTTGGTNPPATTPPGNPVTVAAGATAVDITVPGPSQTPPSNAQFLGTVPAGTAQGASVTLFSTGDIVHQGTTPTVLISGTGIGSTSSVRISGPGDVTVNGALRPLHDATTGAVVPGLAMDLIVAPNAQIGPRTVFITTGNDMTTFTGGLEVVQ